MALRPPEAQQLLGRSGQQGPTLPTPLKFVSQKPYDYAEDNDI